jgi:hypothetical protein
MRASAKALWPGSCLVLLLAACAAAEDENLGLDGLADPAPDGAWDADGSGEPLPDTAIEPGDEVSPDPTSDLVDDDAPPDLALDPLEDPVPDPEPDPDLDPDMDPDPEPDPDLPTDPDAEADLDVPADDSPPAEGTTCVAAIDLTGLTSWTGSFSDFADLWDGGTGCRTALGAEAWFRVTVPDGNRLTLSEISTTDTVLHLVGSCTTTVCAWSSDEPEVFDVYNDTGGAVDYIFAVERYYSGATGPLQLSISNEAPDLGFDCDHPVDVTSLTSWSGSYADYADLWDGTSGCLTASGPEVWFTATVAPGNRFVLEEISSTDVVLHRVSGCGTTACSWSSDTTEKLDFYNDTAGSVTLLVVVERYYSGSSGPVQVSVSNGPPAEGYTCGGAVDVTSVTSWSGSYTSYADMWDGTTGCLSASGAEVWFTATVPDGNTFALDEISSTDVVLHRVSGCGTTVCSWSSDINERFSLANTTGSAVQIYLVVERYYSGATGPIQVNVSNLP